MDLPAHSIRIQAFRGLRNLILEGLGRVNLFVGGTNSGKTSALEAISLLSSPTDPVSWMHVANRREPSPFASLTSSRVDRLRYLFPTSESPETTDDIVLEVEGRVPIQSIRARLTELRGLRSERTRYEADDSAPSEAIAEVERNGLEIQVEIQTRQGTLFPSAESFQVWEDEPPYRSSRSPHFRLPVRAITPYEHWLRHPVTRGFSDAVLGGHELRTMELIRALAPSITDARVLVTQREPALYLKDVNAGFLPLHSFGDGIRRVLTMALALPRAMGGILLIDEMETGLHVSLLSQVYRWIVRACNELDIQLFATTHSLEALDAILEADTTEAEDTVCYQLGRGAPRGAVRMGEKQLRRLRTTRGLDLR